MEPRILCSDPCEEEDCENCPEFKRLQHFEETDEYKKLMETMAVAIGKTPKDIETELLRLENFRRNK